MARFTLPRDIYYGKGALEALKTMKGKKASICVGESSMKKSGFLDKAERYLRELGMDVEIVDGIGPDPSFDAVLSGAERISRFKPDLIVALGGGSVIDAAKAMWVKYEHPDITFEEMRKAFELPELRKKARFCAISSTSGSAAEVTSFSVIADKSAKTKFSIADYDITPDVAIVDPDLTESMPQKVIAHTGMEALAHAVEAYVSTKRSAYSDALALHAVRMIKENLIESYNGDMDARAKMHDAQCLSGMAFSNAFSGLADSMAHKTGPAFEDLGARIIHGAANAMYLPKVIRYNSKDSSALAGYVSIADSLNLGGGSDNAKVVKLVEMIEKLNDSLRIPRCLQEYGKDSFPAKEGFVPAQIFSERLHDIAMNAIDDVCTATNPRKIEIRTMEKLLRACYYGEEVDF